MLMVCPISCLPDDAKAIKTDSGVKNSTYANLKNNELETNIKGFTVESDSGPDGAESGCDNQPTPSMLVLYKAVNISWCEEIILTLWTCLTFGL